MDSHHEWVTKARREADPNGRRLYFAYSTILDSTAFDEWREQHGYDFVLPEGKLAEALDVELVFDFPSRFWGGRVAGIQEKSGSSVFGKLFEVSAQDWPIIQHKEGAVTGMCVEKQVKVRVGGETRDAWAFATSPQRRNMDGQISTRFVEALLRGATHAGLPGHYLAQLKARAGVSP